MHCKELGNVAYNKDKSQSLKANSEWEYDKLLTCLGKPIISINLHEKVKETTTVHRDT